MSIYNNEQIGISVELAVASEYGLVVSDSYVERGVKDIVDVLKPFIRTAMRMRNVPTPVAHIAEGQNPVDFSLEEGKTLSAKSNMRAAGKVAPQNIGQPTSKSFWERLPMLAPSGVDVSKLSYLQSSLLFKSVALSSTVELMNEYWKNLFSCDYILYVSDAVNRDGSIYSNPTVKIFEKVAVPNWVYSDFSFTQSLSSWKESCTVKYKGISIGEWQVHSNRDCFKFRFNISGLIVAGLV